MARAQTQAVPEIQLTTATPEVTLPTPAKTETITREIQRVIVEVPLCTNPPCLDPARATYGGKTYINLGVQLRQQYSKTARTLLQKLTYGLQETDTRLANGKRVRYANEAVVWLIEQLGNGS